MVYNFSCFLVVSIRSYEMQAGGADPAGVSKSWVLQVAEVNPLASFVSIFRLQLQTVAFNVIALSSTHNQLIFFVFILETNDILVDV